MTKANVENPNSAPIEAWARLHRASNTILERVEVKLKAAGFPPLSWYDVLLELRKAEGHSLRPVEIEKRTLLAQYNVSRLIDRIVAAGYAEKRKSSEDGRGVRVCLCPEGEDLLVKMWPIYRQAVQTEFADHLSQGETETLSLILKNLLSQIVEVK
ncbi:Multiple antibiotic resistance protein MarR [Roseibium album]|nr:Multiple antibiotic resistance protein MarR [Roseibium album]